MKLSAIELDASIQCRATIDTAVVNDYAERMSEGDTFPPVEVYGTRTKCWIGDGWHRTLAAKQRGEEFIAAKLNPGGRADALKHALGANALHGHRRTNADKRRCVEIALREFPKLSSRAVAKMCGVGPDLVISVRPAEVSENDTSKRTGQDGKQYPVRSEPSISIQAPGRTTSTAEIREAQAALEPPSNGMHFARMAVMDLEQIREDDAERAVGFAFVKEWIDARKA